MDQASPIPDHAAHVPEGFRDALAELVQIGLSVARMVGRVAEAETALAEAAFQAGVADGVSALAGSLAEAIEADRAAAAAFEMRQTVVARTEAVAGAFARVSRAVRLTVLLAERLDRGWARRGVADDRHAMAQRQIARGVADAIERDAATREAGGREAGGREADGERTARLTDALADRLETLDRESDSLDRPVAEIIRDICRDLGVDPARMTLRPPLRQAVRATEGGGVAPLAGRERGWEACPPQRPPDG